MTDSEKLELKIYKSVLEDLIEKGEGFIGEYIYHNYICCIVYDLLEVEIKGIKIDHGGITNHIKQYCPRLWFKYGSSKCHWFKNNGERIKAVQLLIKQFKTLRYEGRKFGDR